MISDVVWFRMSAQCSALIVFLPCRIGVGGLSSKHALSPVSANAKRCTSSSGVVTWLSGWRQQGLRHGARLEYISKRRHQHGLSDGLSV